MQLNLLKPSALGTQRSSCAARSVLTPRKGVSCKAAANWDNWNGFMERRKSALATGGEEKKAIEDIAGMISKIAPTYKSKFSQYMVAPPAKLTLNALDDVPMPTSLPSDPAAKLQAINDAILPKIVNLDTPLRIGHTKYKTSDVAMNAVLSGTVVEQGTDRSAVLALSMEHTGALDSVVLHWGCSAEKGGAWVGPPPGWEVEPKKARDAGGAVQCGFKQVEGADVLVMQMPLKGVLKAGGLACVLKAAQAGSDLWIKDAGTGDNFYFDLSSFPTTQL